MISGMVGLNPKLQTTAKCLIENVEKQLMENIHHTLSLSINTTGSQNVLQNH